MKLTYTGGLASVAVVLPSRSLLVAHGDEVEVSKEEAEALKGQPGWSPVKPATTKSEED